MARLRSRWPGLACPLAPSGQMQAIEARISRPGRPAAVSLGPGAQRLGNMSWRTGWKIRVWKTPGNWPPPWSIWTRPRPALNSPASFSPEQLPAVIAWLSTTNNVYSLMNEISQGADRISEIVKALKTYSYLDQAPVQEVDVHEGLDSTLVILRSKLGGNQLCARSMPAPAPHHGLRQRTQPGVDQHLDNAADAMNGQGEIILRTRQESARLGGGGNPGQRPRYPRRASGQAIRPLFHDKAAGQGHRAGPEHQLQHRGSQAPRRYQGFFRPGRTVFQVWLPVNFDKVQGSPPTLTGPAQRMTSCATFSRPPRPSRSWASPTAPTGPLTVCPPTCRIRATVSSRSTRGCWKRAIRPSWAKRSTRFWPLCPCRWTWCRSSPGGSRPRLSMRPSPSAPRWCGCKWASSTPRPQTRRAAGLDVVMDQCMFVTHKRLFSS